MKRLFTFLVFLFWGVVLFSQIRIAGRVMDEEGRPLPGANVLLEGTYLGTVTDDQGYFMLGRVPPGDYTLRVSYIGFRTYEKMIQVQKDLSLDIVLGVSDILTDEVVVSGVRAEAGAPVTYTNVSRQEIEEENMGQDMPYILKSLPSMVVSSDAGAGVGYTSFRIRGSDLTRINVTMNGIPMNDPESHGVWWVDMPDLASSVSDIQIQRGVGTSTNGAGAFGASVNLHTFSLEKKPYAGITSSAGSFRTFRNTLRFGTGLIRDHFTFDARFSKIVSDGYIDRASSDLGSLALTGAYYSKKKDIFRLVLMSGREKTYQAWGGVPGYMLDTNRRYNGMGEYTDPEGNIRYYDNETDNYDQDYVQLFYSKEFSRPVWLNMALYYTRGKGYYEQYEEDQPLSYYLLEDVILPGDTVTHTDLIRRKWLDNDLYGITGNLKWKQGRLSLNAGGGWNYYDGGHYGTVIWARYFSNGEKGHRWYDNNGIKRDGNIYAKAGFEVLSGLHLYADMQLRGIRYDMSGADDDQRDLTQQHHYLFFNPKGGVTYDISAGVSVYASFALAHREPTRYDFKEAPVGGPAPQPEVLRDLEAGATLKAGVASFHINLYYMHYKDQLVMTGKINDVGIPIMTNVPKSYRLGMEISGTAQISRDLAWEANLTLSRNKILNFTEYVDDWDTGSQRSFYLGMTDLSFSPPVTASNTFSYRLFKMLEVSWLARYVGKQYIDNTSSNERKLDPYFVNDLAVSLNIRTKVFRKCEIRGVVNNLFNAKYETNAWVYQYYENDRHKVMDGYFPQAGTYFLAGISLKF
jgi:iron complex outermembrane receptor protein